MHATAQQRDWLSPKKLAHELRVHVSSVYRAIDRGELPALRLSEAGALRIPRAELERLITPNKETA
jgi:excisionase family DNA binding protein